MDSEALLSLKVSGRRTSRGWTLRLIPLDSTAISPHTSGLAYLNLAICAVTVFIRNVQRVPMIITDHLSSSITSNLLTPLGTERSPAHEHALFSSGEALAQLMLRGIGTDPQRVRVVTSWIDADYIAKGFIHGLDDAGLDNTFVLFDTAYCHDSSRDDTDLSMIEHQFHEDKDEVDLTVIVLSSLSEPDTISNIMARVQRLAPSSLMVIAAPGATATELTALGPYYAKRSLRTPTLVLGVAPGTLESQVVSSFGWAPSERKGRPDDIPSILQERMSAKKARMADIKIGAPSL